jgi:hypothetical protein
MNQDRDTYFHTYVNILIYMNGTHILDAIYTYLHDIHISEDFKTIPCIRYAYNTAVNAQYQNNINDNTIYNNANHNFDIMLTTALNAVNNQLNNTNNEINQNNQIG